MKTLAILGSSREDGNTKKALDKVTEGNDVEVVYLKSLNISPFDYNQDNLDDDFIPLIEKMITYDRIILASPVYWYSMSGLMKTFFDRWSDLFMSRKDLWEALKGRWIYAVASYGSTYPVSFEIPIRLTTEYMGLHFGGSYFYYCGDDESRQKLNEESGEAFKVLLWGR